jgi:hypothetical protein
MYFQIVGGQLQIDAFGVDEVRCLSLISQYWHTLPLVEFH